MERPNLDTYVPSWSPVFENYALSWIKRHGWKVQHELGEFDDQLQECAYVFSWCKARYTVKTPQHFMALYKAALFSHWVDNARRDSLIKQNVEFAPQEGSNDIEQVGEAVESTDLGFVLTYHSLSAEAKKVLSIIADAPAELLGWLLSDQSEDTLNRVFQRILRVGPGVASELLLKLRP